MTAQSALKIYYLCFTVTKWLIDKLYLILWEAKGKKVSKLNQSVLI